MVPSAFERLHTVQCCAPSDMKILQDGRDDSSDDLENLVDVFDLVITDIVSAHNELLQILAAILLVPQLSP